MKVRRIALIGERDPGKRAHAGIEASLALYQRGPADELDYFWVPTAALSEQAAATILGPAAAVWCTPGSPYENLAGALRAIQHARLTGKPFLGTCGGFQHALMEFAQNVLHRPAAHQEIDPDAADPLLVKLSCSLVGVQGTVVATRPERFATWLGGRVSTEEFHCNYGLNPTLEQVFHGSALVFVAHDEHQQARAFRLDGHPFFVGTLFQPERRVFSGSLHPLVRAFFDASLV
jgi:CTP synthase (UTP-ammonia lyase)